MTNHLELEEEYVARLLGSINEDGWLVSDLKKCLKAEAIFLATRNVCTGIENLGAFLSNKQIDSPNFKAFEYFIETRLPQYSIYKHQLWKLVRCPMVHGFYPDYRIGIILATENHLKINEEGRLCISATKIYEDFYKAIESLKSDLETYPDLKKFFVGKILDSAIARDDLSLLAEIMYTSTLQKTFPTAIANVSAQPLPPGVVKIISTRNEDA